MSAAEILVSDISAGTVLAGRYTIIEKIGEGTVASVYLAEDRGDRRVALKIPDPLRGADPVGRQRFLREFEILSRLSHPNIARCVRLDRHAELDLLVLEHIEGETLRARLDRGRLSIAQATELASQLARALIACHAADVLHRDLKPANVILHPDRGAVILDFGVAWFSSAANLTRTGALVGTPEYMAPEVFTSSLADVRADVYSLGAMLFEMLTGRRLYLTESVTELVEAQREADPPAARSLRPDVPKALSDIVARAVCPRPEGRFATAAELARALTSGRFALGRELAARIPCPHCRTPLVVDLDFCPGCGGDASWDLAAGPYAVQLEAMPDAARVKAWIEDRYRYALTPSLSGLSHRLARLPVPLITEASPTSAEQLAQEARALGCEAEVIRARAVLGAKLDVRNPGLVEGLAAAALHFAGVMLAAMFGVLVGAPFPWLCLLPLILAVSGIGLARGYVRRPLLVAKKKSPSRSAMSERVLAIRAKLAELKTSRARHVAATAVARAAPVILGDLEGLPSAGPEDVLGGLERAMDAVVALDVHAEVLGSRSRSRLSAEILEAASRAARGEEGAIARLAELEAEKNRLAEAAIAHDLAARMALEAAESITIALSARTTAADVGRALDGR